jgi:hypothetical protein
LRVAERCSVVAAVDRVTMSTADAEIGGTWVGDFELHDSPWEERVSILPAPNRSPHTTARSA